MEKRFYVSSVGDLFQVSLDQWGARLVDENGKEIKSDDINLNQTVFAEYQGPTTITRTSVTRIQ